MLCFFYFNALGFHLLYKSKKIYLCRSTSIYVLEECTGRNLFNYGCEGHVKWIRQLIVARANNASASFIRLKDSRSKNGSWIQSIQTQGGSFGSNLNQDFQIRDPSVSTGKDSQKVCLASDFHVILLFERIARKTFQHRACSFLTAIFASKRNKITSSCLYYCREVPRWWKTNSSPCFSNLPRYARDVCWVLNSNGEKSVFGFCVRLVLKNPYELRSQIRFQILPKKRTFSFVSGKLIMMKFPS